MEIAKFSADIKLFQIIRCLTCSEEPQKDLTELTKWAGRKWGWNCIAENIRLGIKGTAI